MTDEFGLTFTTSNGREFILNQIQPGVYLGTVNLTSSTSFTFPELNGQADIYPELLNRTYRRGGNGQVSSIVRFNYTQPEKGKITISFSNANVASFVARFALFARFS
ncbi:hypothetical protein H8F06_21485 [Vibrio fluvialis]|uniref:hypothetical protein n=1 Tax=Vibrio fluvialis TaxID=676 RepID=UPI00192CC222|nr:hypothetical protein [Vibrio fluvialis]MBL4297855.1 hypothetical protein [Vibrio fluvialis]